MNTIKYLASVAFILTIFHTVAQNKLEGTIYDYSTNESLPGISVYLPDLKRGTITDENGNYLISNLKNGSYLIEVRGMGYQPIVNRIELKQDTIIHFNLTLSAMELDEVIITGVTRSTEIKLNPIIVKTIDINTFNQNSSTNVINALQNVPGISEISTGPSISKPIIRGLGYNRVITLNNGIRQEGQQWGDEHGIEIDEYSVDRVEIIKGPGSLMYGSDGIAGVLNFLSPKTPLEGSVNTQIQTNYQSNNNLIGYSLSNAGNNGGIQWYGNFSNKYVGNYQNKYDGKVYNSGFNELNGRLSLGITKMWGHSYLTVSSYNTKLGIVEGERDDKGNFIYEDENGNEVTATKSDLRGYTIGIPQQQINHLSIASNNYIIFSKGSLNIDVGFQNNRRREYEEAETPNEVGLSLSLNTITYNARYNLEKLKGWETAVGISGMLQQNKNKGITFLIPDYNLFDIGTFFYSQKTFNKFTLAGGIRFDYRRMDSNELFLNKNGMPTPDFEEDSELKFPHFKKNYSGLSGSVGFTYQIQKNSTLKFNLSRGFRAPSSAELASNGKHEGTFKYEVGNLNLKPEQSHQMDVGYFLNTEHLNLEISPFINFIRNYSFLEKMKDENGNDILFDSTDFTPAFQYTSGNATLLGGEIYVDWHPHPLDWLHIENAFSYVQATQNNQSDDSKYLPFIPAPHYRGGIKAAFNKLSKSLAHFYVKFDVDYYFAQTKIYSAFETETKTVGYTLLSAGIGAHFNLFNRKDFICLYLVGNNLADKAYQSHLSRLKYTAVNPVTERIGVFDSGRNISLKIILNF